MFDSPVGRLGGAVGGAGPVEVGQDVGGRLDSVRSSVVTSLNAAGTPVLTDSISLVISARLVAR